MLKKGSFTIKNQKDFFQKAIFWLNQFEVFSFFNSNQSMQYQFDMISPPEFDFIAGGIYSGKYKSPGSFRELKDFTNNSDDWYMGYLGYDLKNEIEMLSSNNLDPNEFPNIHFFRPDFIITLKNNIVDFIVQTNNLPKPDALLKSINDSHFANNDKAYSTKIESRISKEEYLDKVEKIKKHIQRGDIYEINFCQEFYAENANLNPIQIYNLINSTSPSPFSCLYKLNDKYLISISPERFLKKTGDKVISQPMKGTAKRSPEKAIDLRNRDLLLCEKEQSENIMITDLVRNDLSRTAKKGSVKAEEICGIYSYQQAHQMVSTVSSRIADKYSGIDVIKNAFPMGSMTGAPKVRAMKLIERYEATKRGVYSGSAGYIKPGGDFDFNVIIRSILYNQSKKYVSFSVGSAITSKSIAEEEYKECLVKAAPMMKILKSSKINAGTIS